MRLASALCLFLALFGLSFASQDPKCFDKPGVNGVNGMICLAFGYPYWSYYVEETKCKSFEYTGCSNSINLFSTQEECETACVFIGEKK